MSDRTFPEIPVRAPAKTSSDDTILPFEIDALDVRGRVVRLGPVVNEILTRHAYPAPVAKLLGEAIALGALLGSSLKFEGRFILQTQSDGAVSMLVVDFVSPGRMRGYARFDRERLEAALAEGRISPGELLGRGHLAMTIDRGPDQNRYQGLVALHGEGLEAAAHEYFLRSEQIPTRVRLAVAEELKPGPEGTRHRWRAGGILLQFLPRAPERLRVADLDPGDAPQGTASHTVAEDDAWVEGRSMVETVEDVELIDPSISSEQLLFRLFHERGVRVFRAHPVEARCSCSREAVASMLRSFSADERRSMIENDVIKVTCEFCSAGYVFAPESVLASDSDDPAGR